MLVEHGGAAIVLLVRKPGRHIGSNKKKDQFHFTRDIFYKRKENNSCFQLTQSNAVKSVVENRFSIYLTSGEI